MSTLPGDDALRDAGLTGPEIDEAVNLAEEVTRSLSDDVPQEPDDPEAPDVVSEEYRPGTPRPDLAGEADEADVIEQSWTVPSDDDEAHA